MFSFHLVDTISDLHDRYVGRRFAIPAMLLRIPLEKTATIHNLVCSSRSALAFDLAAILGTPHPTMRTYLSLLQQTFVAKFDFRCIN